MKATHLRATPKLLAALLMALTCGASLAAAPAGYVQFASADVKVKGLDGVERAALKGMELQSGDTIATGRGRAQLRFSDGAYLSLQPESVFRIDEYRYEGKPDGTERGFFSLVKGGVRTITGWVGRLNRDNYQVTTPTATIGIRGTEYLAALGNSLTVSVGEGRVAVTNLSGEFIVEAGQSVYVADPNTRPAVTSDKPFLPPAPAREGMQPPPAPGFVVTDVVDPAGVPVAVSGGGGNSFIVANGAGDRPNNSIAVISAAGPGTPTCTSAGACDKLKIGALNLNNVDAQVLDSGFDLAVGWGRWSNGKFTAGGTGNVQASATQGLHYVYGDPTLPANLPTGTATYSVLGATRATSGDGSLGLGTFSGNLDGVSGRVLEANFTSGSVRVGFQVDFAAATYAVNNQTLALSGSTFAGSGVAATGTGCASAACSASINGFFAGPAAERAGMGYQIATPGNTVSGAAALGKN